MPQTQPTKLFNKFDWSYLVEEYGLFKHRLLETSIHPSGQDVLSDVDEGWKKAHIIYGTENYDAEVIWQYY